VAFSFPPKGISFPRSYGLGTINQTIILSSMNILSFHRVGDAKGVILFSSIALLLFAGLTAGHVQAATWSGGGVNGNWSTAANWDTVPTGAVTLVFAGTTNLITSNDIAGITANGLTFNAGAGAFTLGGPQGVILGGNIADNSTNPQTISLGLTLNANRTVDMVAGGSINISGTIAQSGTGRALTKTGSGTLTLSGSTNSYGGATTVSGGSLALDYSANDNTKLADAAALNLGFGANVNLVGGTHTEIVSATTLNLAAASTITRASGTAVLRMNAITRNAGSAIDFGAAGIADTDTSNNAGGIIGGHATVAGANWAVSAAAAADTPITALAVYNANSFNGTDNTDITSDQAPGTFTINSLRYNTAAPTTLTLTGTNTISSGGILVTSTVGSNATTISGGTLQGASGADLIIHQYNTASPLTISSAIVDNGMATGLTKVGPGALTLTGNNTYTGTTTVQGGILNFEAGTINAPTAQLLVNQGTMNFGTATSAPSITLNNAPATTAGEYITIGNVAGGSATFNMVNGTLNIIDTSTTTTRRFALANGLYSTATWNQTGGAVTFSGAGFTAGGTPGFFGANQTGSTTAFNISGGTFNVGDMPVMVATRGVGSLNISGTGVFISTGMGTTAGNAVLGLTINDDRQPAGALASVATLNLDAGGRLEASAIRMTANRGGQVVTSIVNLNGGTLRARATNPNFWIHGGGTDIATVNVKVGGALIDSNGFDIGINVPLLHDAALGATPDGGLTKTGNGKLTLSAVNTYTGATTVNAGALLVTGSLDAASAVTVNAGGTLGGSGTIGGAVTINTSGTLAPGTSPGILSAGNTTFAGGTLSLEINSSTVSTGYDQLNVTGTVSLTSNSPLNLTLGYDPVDGMDTFTIINNDGGDAVNTGSGLFTFFGSPLAEGAQFTAGSQLFQISYAGGDGNDVVVSAIAIPEPGTVVALLGGLGALASRRRRRAC
jgi:autotransporter-associated beta strand protein